MCNTPRSCPPGRGEAGALICPQGHHSLPFLTRGRESPVAEKPVGCKAVSGHESVHSWRGNQREAKGLGRGASGLCGNPRPHTDFVMHRCPWSRDDGTGEPQQGRGPGTGRPTCPPFSAAKIRELPVNQVNTTKGILPTRAPTGQGDPEKEAG